MMRLLYSLFVRTYGFAIQVAAIWNAKARKWARGRNHVISTLQSALDPYKRYIWIHAASLGEFEQGRPLIEMIAARHPEVGIVLTFFSPSGYEVRKEYEAVDIVSYMLLDTPANASAFVKTVNPILAIFVKYELWYHHLKALKSTDVPTLLISAQFRPGQFYFKWYGLFFWRLMKSLDRIFVTHTSSLDFLRSHGFQNVSLAGDTRMDRVLEIASSPGDWSWLSDLLGEVHLLIAGSTWPEDEELLLPAVAKSGWKLILAPHEIGENRINSLKRSIQGRVFTLSELRTAPRSCDVVIVDTIGELSSIYSAGTAAYVGGGFGNGIHNVLEPIAHGIPVCFGPNHRRFQEAGELLAADIAKTVHTADQMFSILDNWANSEYRNQVRSRIAGYIQTHRGAAEKIYGYIREQDIL